MIGDLEGLAQWVSTATDRDKRDEALRKLGPFPARIVTEITKPGVNLLECVCRLFPIDQNTSGRNGSARSVLGHLYHVAVACVAVHAVLSRFGMLLRLRGSHSSSAYEVFDAINDGRKPSVLRFDAEGDFLDAVVEALCSDSPEDAIVELVANEAASRLGLKALDSRLREYVHRHVGLFVALGLEGYQLRIKQGIPNRISTECMDDAF